MRKMPNCVDCNVEAVLLTLNIPGHGEMFAGGCPSCKFYNAPSHTEDGAKSTWYRTNIPGQPVSNKSQRAERKKLIAETTMPEVLAAQPLK